MVHVLCWSHLSVAAARTLAAPFATAKYMHYQILQVSIKLKLS